MVIKQSNKLSDMKDVNISGTIFSFAIHRWQRGSFSALFNKLEADVCC